SLLGTASWLDEASVLGVLSVPIGLLMIAGEFDLSIGSMVGASSIIVAVGNSYYHLPIWLAIALAILCGVLVGLLNGLLTVRTGLPSFIVTLAALFMVEGAALGISRAAINTSAMSVYVGGSANAVFGSSWDTFSVSIVWWVGAFALASWVLHKTRFGNWIFATGGNVLSARSSGVPTSLVKVSLFVSTAVGASIVGILETMEYHGGDVTYGADFVFSAPVAAVIGGVLLGGGYGATIGIMAGTAIYAIVSIGVNYTGINSDWTELIIGVLMLYAVLANNFVRRAAMRSRSARSGQS
ncbi:MAG TPA: ABC transporter permease, partial [Acidothermaceae bacterium]|nr:ABC transporter permease [Acidothermaceae bacterium]